MSTDVTIRLSPEKAEQYASYLEEAGKHLSAAFVRREIARIVAGDGPATEIVVTMRPDAELSN